MFEQTVQVDAIELRGLFSTFSPVLALDAQTQAEVLNALERLAKEQFSNRVVRTFSTRLYLARKAD